MAHPKIVRLFVRCSLDTLDWADSLQSLYQHSLLPSDFYERLVQLIDKGQLRCKDIFIFSILIDSLILFPHMMHSALTRMNPEQTADQILETRFEAIIDLFENGMFSVKGTLL